MGSNESKTKAIYNATILIKRPEKRLELPKWRAWSKSYAEQEWLWYKDATLDPTRVIQAGASLWDTLRDEDGNVMSNYGYWWKDQLPGVIKLLREDPKTRRAVISLYDGNKAHMNDKDVICTLGIQFSIRESRLHMTVMMRSNDLWFGFPNDTYCFSKLQEQITLELGLKMGTYTHIVNNLHLYNNKLNKNQVT